MRVIRAEAMGMCFGVRDALDVIERIEHPETVTIHGELVHNPVVLKRLDERGFGRVSEDDRARVPATSAVLITAHGISDQERQRLESAARQLIDTTCPLVRRVHETAQALAREGRLVLIVGKPGHVEVRGVAGDLEACEVVERVEDVKQYDSRWLGVVCQTTVPPDVAREICSFIQLYNPLADIRFVDTICSPTKQRQQAIHSLLEQVDAVVVVGGRNSNNTRQLVELCHRHAKPALHIENAAELDPGWFADVAVVGLTAGTSTLPETIDEVYRALLSMGN